MKLTFYIWLKHCLGVYLVPIYLLPLLFATTLLCGERSEAAEVKVDLGAIASIESSNNPMAYNKQSGARGMYQITEICLKEYNNFHKGKEVAREELFNPAMARNVADWYVNVRITCMLKHYGIKDTIENRLWCYNAGIGNVLKRRLPTETREYIRKYHKLTKGK